MAEMITHAANTLEMVRALIFTFPPGSYRTDSFAMSSKSIRVAGLIEVRESKKTALIAFVC